MSDREPRTPPVVAAPVGVAPTLVRRKRRTVDVTAFPTDEVTLAVLRESCLCGDDGQSHLFDFLHFGTVEAERTHLAGNVVEVTYAEGRAPFSPQQVIVALCDEITRLRGQA